ncbi:hypothetical protein D3C77_165760 [compost metagenome]
MRGNLRQVAATQVNPQWLADIESLINILRQENFDQCAAQGHDFALAVLPDEFAAGGDAVIGDVHAEGVFAEAHDMLAQLAVIADKTLELVGGGTDIL